MATKINIELGEIFALTYRNHRTGKRKQIELKAVERKTNSCEDCFLRQYSCYRFVCVDVKRNDNTNIKFLQNDN